MDREGTEKIGAVSPQPSSRTVKSQRRTRGTFMRAFPNKSFHVCVPKRLYPLALSRSDLK